MESETIKFGTVFDEIQHYQREKACLEEILRELNAKGVQLTDDAQGEFRNRVTAADRLSRATKTFKLVQHKVDELQAFLSGLRETLQRGTANVEHLNREIANEKLLVSEEVKTFDGLLEAVGKQLKSSKRILSSEGLETLLDEKAKTKSELDQKIEEMRRQMQFERCQFERLKIVNDTESKRVDELKIPGKVQGELFDMLQLCSREQVIEIESLNQLRRKLGSDLTQLQSF